jgi:hypothetical protein
MTLSPNLFLDPTKIPIKFSQRIPKPIFAFGESAFPVSFSFYDRPRKAVFSGAAATQLGKLLTDKNVYSDPSVIALGLGESSRFILNASGTNISTTEFYLTTTRLDTSTFAVSSSGLMEIRQPLFGAEIPHIFASHQSTRAFDGYVEGINTYYPAAIMKLNVHKTLSSGNEDFLNIYTSEDSDTSIVLAEINSWGLVDVEIEVTLLWYTDEARTIVAVSHPTIDTPSFGIRMYVSDGDKMSEKMIVSGNSCIASALYPNSVLRNLGGDFVDLVYWGSGEDGNGLFWDREFNIEVSTNGLAIQDGVETSTYILDNQLIDYDFSSSSSSSTSSENSKSSKSTVLNTSSISSSSSITSSSDSSVSSSSNSSQSSPSESSISSSSMTSVTSVSSTSSTALLDLSSTSSVVYNYLRSSSSSLEASLLAKYSFSTAPNTFGQVLDSSGNARHLSIGTASGGLGPPKWGADYGISGGGFWFAADSSHCDYLQAMTTSWPAGAKSIGFWFKPDGKGNTKGIPICVSNGYVSDLTKTEFALQTDTTDKKISSWLKINGTMKWAFNTPNDSIVVGSWNHIVIVHNGAEPYVYINGSPVILSYTTTTAKSVWLSGMFSSDYKPDRFVVGGAPRYYSPFMAIGFSGQIDEIMIWDEALSASAAVDEYDKMEMLSSQSFSSYSTTSEST